MDSQDIVFCESSFPQLPLARYQLCSTTNPDVARTKLSEALAPSVTVQQLIPRFEQSPSDFLYTHNGICLHNITINAISYGSPVVLKLQDIRRFLFFVLVIRGECRIASGENGFVAKANGGTMYKGKVGAAVVAVRRAGSTFTYSAINFFFGISEITICTSSYWNMTLALEPGDVQKDAEGIQTFEVLGQNMAKLLKQVNA